MNPITNFIPTLPSILKATTAVCMGLSLTAQTVLAKLAQSEEQTTPSSTTGLLAMCVTLGLGVITALVWRCLKGAGNTQAADASSPRLTSNASIEVGSESAPLKAFVSIRGMQHNATVRFSNDTTVGEVIGLLAQRLGVQRSDITFIHQCRNLCDQQDKNLYDFYRRDELIGHIIIKNANFLSVPREEPSSRQSPLSWIPASMSSSASSSSPTPSRQTLEIGIANNPNAKFVSFHSSRAIIQGHISVETITVRQLVQLIADRLEVSADRVSLFQTGVELTKEEHIDGKFLPFYETARRLQFLHNGQVVIKNTTSS